MMRKSKAFYRGCLLGGAVGDALGYAVEFMSIDEIRENFGECGIREPIRDATTGKALISDDTQMTIFTTDGLLWADSKVKTKGIYSYIPCLFYAYQKWLYTQTGNFAEKGYEFLLNGEILKWEELFARRAPGKTCLTSLSGSINGRFGTVKNRINDSKGCGAVMRAAPIGLYFARDPIKAFTIGYESGAITHGHPSGYLAAGLLAFIIARIINGDDLKAAVLAGLAELSNHHGHEEITHMVERAVTLAEQQSDPYENLIALGEGWVGEETIAIAIYAALRFKDDFEEAVCLAANHSGDSDSTAAVCGNIMGALLGSLEIPYKWIRDIELSDLIVHGADELLKASKDL